MTNKDEALKMAIEALSQDEGWFEPEEAINACKKALEQPFTRDWKETIYERIARDSEFKEALEQPEGKEFFERGKEIARWADKPAQEPVALNVSNNPFNSEKHGLEVLRNTHPHQDEASSSRASAWQGLTDDEINEVCLELFETPAVQGDLEFCYAIEAKLKEKNTP